METELACTIRNKAEAEYLAEWVGCWCRMKALLGGDHEHMRDYIEFGRTRRYPLPCMVRNILSHKGHNPNQLDANGEDIRASILLLREWVS